MIFSTEMPDGTTRISISPPHTEEDVMGTFEKLVEVTMRSIKADMEMKISEQREREARMKNIKPEDTIYLHVVEGVVPFTSELVADTQPRE